jgi:hypothetical protein
MAIHAKEWRPVVTRIAGRLMTKEQRHPEIVVMAVIAFPAGDEMRRIFAGRRDAIMTSRARTRNAVMIKICRYPRNGRMTDITLGSSCDMSFMFSVSDISIMAT